MKLAYTKDATLNSQGIYFMKGKPYTVSDKVGKYLLDTFGDSFKVIEEPKAKAPEAPAKRAQGRKASTTKEG